MVEEDKLLEVWRAQYNKLSNEKLSWDSLTDVSPLCGPSEKKRCSMSVLQLVG